MNGYDYVNTESQFLESGQKKLPISSGVSFTILNFPRRGLQQQSSSAPIQQRTNLFDLHYTYGSQ